MKQALVMLLQKQDNHQDIGYYLKNFIVCHLFQYLCIVMMHKIV